ncbi:MAG: hypothetical protein WCG10_07060, partial [Chlamydiota bacterium]
MVESTFIKSQENDLVKQLSIKMDELFPVWKQLQQLTSIQAKNDFLDSLPKLQDFFNRRSDLLGLQVFLSDIERYFLKVVIVIDQADHILHFPKDEKGTYITCLIDLLKDLIAVEEFYDQIGGVLGYYYKSLELLYELHHKQKKGNDEILYPPKGVDIAEDTPYVRDAIIQGITWTFVQLGITG